MNFYRNLNIFAIGLPFATAAVEYLTYQGIYFAVIATMLTGIIQVYIAILLAFDKRICKNLIAYFTMTTSFFLAWSLTDWQFIWCMPPMLTVYMTVILYLDESSTFLTAEWKNLLLINYEVDPAILANYLPAGTELELYNGKCYVSLVGFLFQNTRVCGVKILQHINFEEVNVRFYVTRKDGATLKRGVVFVKEIVPRRAIAAIANLLYKEHYEYLPMRHSTIKVSDALQIEYCWKKGNKWNSIAVNCNPEPLEIETDTEAEFITEHYFGYTKVDANRTFEYEVTHPRWQQLEVTNYKIDVDFEANYGQRFAFLGVLKPTSVLLAGGSEITVKDKVAFRVKNSFTEAKLEIS